MDRSANESLFQSVGVKNRLVDRVADEIKRLIASGQLAPGVRLPPEREFAEQLGVSRPVIREAMHQLVAKGLLESKHGSGTTVREVTRNAVVEPLGWLVQARGVTIDHLHQVRCILEGEIVRLAARQANGERLAELREILRDMEAKRDETDTFAALDADFHQALAETTENPLLVVLLGTVQDLMQEVRLEVHQHEIVSETVLRDHEKLIATIAARDPDAAHRAMQSHLDHAHEFQKAFIEADNTP